VSGAAVQTAIVALVLLGAAAYLARRAWTRLRRARQPQSGGCGPNCGCGDDADY